MIFARTLGPISWLGESRQSAFTNTEQKVSEADEEYSSLTFRLLQAQDEERRHIARELHDSVGQLLTAMTMNLGSLRSMELPADAKENLEDNQSLVDEAIRQIRTISYLLHPPFLEEFGLSSALACCVEGFSTRSKIRVTFEAPKNLGRYHRDVEIAVYRVVQECLTNIHRHSGSATGLVKLTAGRKGLEVVVRDRGKGIPRKTLEKIDAGLGIGLAGMKQRITQMGGLLEIQSDSAGTVVRAKLPRAHAMSSSRQFSTC